MCAMLRVVNVVKVDKATKLTPAAKITFATKEIVTHPAMRCARTSSLNLKQLSHIFALLP